MFVCIPYIPAQYRGKGIDLRERKIWCYYGGRADLEVCSLTPSDVTVFPEFDWLIGNHSDELTPWIPLMAARFDLTMNVGFHVPCFHICIHVYTLLDRTLLPLLLFVPVV